MGIDSHLVAGSVTTAYRVEISRDNANGSPGTADRHRYEFGVEYLFHVEFANIGSNTAIRDMEPKAYFNLNAIIRSPTRVHGVTRDGSGKGKGNHRSGPASSRGTHPQ